VNWLPDRDQVGRGVPLVVRLKSAIFASVALEAGRGAQGADTNIGRSSKASGETAFGQQTGVNALRVGDLEVQTGASADIRPYYTTTPPDRFISFTPIFRTEVSKEDVEGRIILIGTTAAGLSDMRATPLE